MAGFDASSIGAMTYDFTGFGVDAVGVIPEPTDKQIREFRAFWRGQLPLEEIDRLEQLREAARKDPSKSAELTKAIRETQDKLAREELLPGQLDALAVLCGATVVGSGKARKLTGGSPTREQLEALPYRAKVAFVAYVNEEMSDPKATGGTAN